MKLEQKTLLLCLVAVSIAFNWVVAPYLSAIFWATVLAVLFAPLYRWMLPVVRHYPTPAALATLFVAVADVGVPIALITASLLRQTAAVYADMASRRIDFGAYLQRARVQSCAWET